MFTIKLRNGQTHTSPRPMFADLVAFERHFNVPAPKIDENPKAEWVAFLVWRGLRWQQIPVGEFEEFIDQIEELTINQNGDGGASEGKAEEPPPSE